MDPELEQVGPETLSLLVDLKSQLRLLEPYDLYCSPLRRAHDTAELVSGIIEPSVDPRLSEWALGSWEGERHEDVRIEYPECFDSDGRWDPHKTPPGGEPFAAVERRVRSFLDDHRRVGVHVETPLVIVTHNGVIRMMRYLARQIPSRLMFDRPEDPLQLLELG